MAAPTKYTPTTIARLEEAIAKGASLTLACKYAGICADTLFEWRKTKPGFSDRLEKAEGQAALRWLATIEQAAADGVWQAAAWKLERRYPQDYGRTVHEHTGADGGPVRITFSVAAAPAFSERSEKPGLGGDGGAPLLEAAG